MVHYGDVIPISSRRRGPPAGGSRPARRAAIPLVIVLAVVAVIVAIGMFLQGRTREAVVEQSAAARQAIFTRAYLDLVKTCTLPEATQSPVREHCAHQATFVLQLPECDTVCVRAAHAIQRHTR